MPMYYLINEYCGWSHSETLIESDDFDIVMKEYDRCIEETLQETDSATDALYIENEDGDVLIEHLFTESNDD